MNGTTHRGAGSAAAPGFGALVLLPFRFVVVIGMPQPGGGHEGRASLGCYHLPTLAHPLIPRLHSMFMGDNRGRCRIIFIFVLGRIGGGWIVERCGLPQAGWSARWPEMVWATDPPRDADLRRLSTRWSRARVVATYISLPVRPRP